MDQRTCLGVVQPLSQALRVDADVDVSALIHELQVRRTVNPCSVAGESQMQLQRDAGRVLWRENNTPQSITHGEKHGVVLKEMCFYSSRMH